MSYRTLLALPQTWGIIIGKTLTDPVWFFITDWFAIYLVSKGHRLEESLLAFWIPFLAADVGNFAGGGLSSWLIGRGWPVGAARKLVVVMSRVGDDAADPDGVHRLVYMAGRLLCDVDARLRGVLDDGAESAGRHLSDRFGRVGQRHERHGRRHRHDPRHVPTGVVADRYSFEPILIAASLIPLGATLAVVTLVRNNRATEEGIVNRI